MLVDRSSNRREAPGQVVDCAQILREGPLPRGGEEVNKTDPEGTVGV